MCRTQYSQTDPRPRPVEKETTWLLLMPEPVVSDSRRPGDFVKTEKRALFPQSSSTKLTTQSAWVSRQWRSRKPKKRKNSPSPGSAINMPVGEQNKKPPGHANLVLPQKSGSEPVRRLPSLPCAITNRAASTGSQREAKGLEPGG